MRTYFEHNFETIKSKLLLMGQMSNESLKLSIQALMEFDSVLAKSIREKDREIDELENELSVAITSYLSTHAPVAADLRFLVATMKISHEIERIGDESKAIARRSLKTTTHEFHEIPKMAKLAQDMLKDALSVFAEYDEEKAKDIWKLDITIDQLHQENNRFYQSLVEKDPHQASSVFETLFISKSIERICDHAVNVSKEVVFIATSRGVRHALEYKKSVLRKEMQ